MEGVVVGAVIGATSQVLLQNLLVLIMKEIQLIRGFKKEMKKLRITLITIQEFIYDAETLQHTNKPIKRWLKKLEDVAFQAYYVLDEIDYLSLHKDRQKLEHKHNTFNKMIKFMTSPFLHDGKFGKKIMNINNDFESVNREASGLGLQIRLAVNTTTAPASWETDGYVSDPVFLGRDDDVKKIVETLTNLPTDQVSYILPIVGMGGIGKSTLARQVLKVQTRFETRIWVHVSANFDPIMLFKKILTVLTLKDVKVKNREVVLKKLQRALANKTYLLVLDDVWNEESLQWKDFINSLSGVTSSKGNGIIVTTRNGNVASTVATLPIHELKGLQEDICWSIIKAKAFQGDMIIPSEFESIGKNIAKRCQGLSLAANVVGGVLCGKSKDEWVLIQENWLSDHVEGDFITKVLKLSFDHLPSPSLQKCFAYCSIFPKGARMVRVHLIELWMAEGYLESDQKSDMETVGNNFFNLLLHNSLLQHAGTQYLSKEFVYCMHDLVHDMAMKVNHSGIYRARYSGHELYGDESKENEKYVRTLFLRGGTPHAMFSGFKSLHALTLIGYHVKELPSSIRELKHLRYLNVSDTNIKELPDMISELYHLLTLRAESYSLRKLPSTLKYLIGLRHLHVLVGAELPGELGTLTSLQTIPWFEVRDEKGHRIVELGSLKNLKGKLRINNLEKVRDKEEAKSACIFQKPDIAELVLQWNDFEEVEKNNEEVLEGLQPHPNLNKLSIVGFNGTRFPLWALKMGVQDERQWRGLNNLMEIRLSRCYECEQVPMMGHLPHLKSLFLDDLWNVKSIGPSFYGLELTCHTVFPSLQRLELQNMPKMREWVEVQVEVFPCLKYLVITVCKELKSVPSLFPCLKELDFVHVDSGLALANICGNINLKSLTKLRIEGVKELESLPHGLFYNNQHLSELDIEDCPRLRDLPDGLHTLNPLPYITIHNCPTLKSDCSTPRF